MSGDGGMRGGGSYFGEEEEFLCLCREPPADGTVVGLIGGKCGGQKKFGADAMGVRVENGIARDIFVGKKSITCRW